ncbi:hypothetical protein FNAPI_2076 [Fusarium napiforme]|uniref:Uncharacterized protein n=1 Tax=Fusarium napiforme TaxID=42672 RepID=A0A8H5K1G0_9HYPO|nr:hypothetical protein FNAPI_2076 [Fusarium napiforme]
MKKKLALAEERAQKYFDFWRSTEEELTKQLELNDELEKELNPPYYYIAVRNLKLVSKDFKQVVEAIHYITAISVGGGKVKFTMVLDVDDLTGHCNTSLPLHSQRN